MPTGNPYTPPTIEPDAGGVTSVNGDTGPAVVLDAADVGADAAGAAAAAQAAAIAASDPAGAAAAAQAAAAAALAAHAGANPASHVAASVPFTPAGTIAANRVQAAVEEVATDAAAALAVHLAANPAHAAANVSAAPGGTIAATNVQAYMEELRDEAVHFARREFVLGAWVWSGGVLVPVAGANYLPPTKVGVMAGQAVSLVRCYYKLRAGTGTTQFDLMLNGSLAHAAYDNLTFSTSWQVAAQTVALANADELVPLVVAAGTAPDGMSIIAMGQETLTLSVA